MEKQRESTKKTFINKRPYITAAIAIFFTPQLKSVLVNFNNFFSEKKNNNERKTISKKCIIYKPYRTKNSIGIGQFLTTTTKKRTCICAY